MCRKYLQQSEGKELYSERIEAGGLIMGGMEECTLGGREGGKEEGSTDGSDIAEWCAGPKSPMCC